MPLIVVAVILAVACNALRRRPPFALGDLPWRAAWLVAACLAAQVVATGASGHGRAALVVCSQAVMTAWLAWQAGRFVGTARWAMAAMAVGAALNLVPIAEHGSMPVAPGALAVAGAGPTTDVDDSLGQLGKHVLSDGAGATWWLGDSIGVPSSGVVVSPGDLAMLAGIVWLTLAASARRRDTRVLEVDGDYAGAVRDRARRDVQIAH
jgi:hypothetical protein